MTSDRCECGSCPTPLLKWNGGKSYLLKDEYRFLLPRPQDPQDGGGTYREPFLGGGAFAAHYLHAGVPCALSDAEAPLIAMYRGVRDAPEEVIERLRALDANYSEATYFAVRTLFNEALLSPEATSDAEWASWLIFLNKTGFNGGYRMSKKGQYNIPFGNPKGLYKKPRIVHAENILAWARELRRDGVTVEQSDYVAQVRKVQRGDLVFLDPPYVPHEGNKDGAGHTAYTAKGFNMSDQEQLAEMLPDVDLAGAKFMLTNHVEAAHLYEGWDITRIPVKRSGNSDARGRGDVLEIVVRNYTA